MAHFDVPTSTIYRGLVSGKTVTRNGTIKTGQGIVLRGQVLELTTPANTYIKCATPANAIGILAQDVDATSADVVAPVIRAATGVKINALILGALDVTLTLEALGKTGIAVETVEETTGLIVRPVAPGALFMAQQQPAPEQAPTGPLNVGEEIAIRHAEGDKAIDSLTGDGEEAIEARDRAAEEAEAEQETGDTEEAPKTSRKRAAKEGDHNK